MTYVAARYCYHRVSVRKFPKISGRWDKKWDKTANPLSHSGGLLGKGFSGLYPVEINVRLDVHERFSSSESVTLATLRAPIPNYELPVRHFSPNFKSFERRSPCFSSLCPSWLNPAPDQPANSVKALRFASMNANPAALTVRTDSRGSPPRRAFASFFQAEITLETRKKESTEANARQTACHLGGPTARRGRKAGANAGSLHRIPQLPLRECFACARTMHQAQLAARPAQHLSRLARKETAGTQRRERNNALHA
jgi:hypothetical protein